MEITKQDLETQIRLLMSQWSKLNSSERLSKCRYAGPCFDESDYDNLLCAVFNDWWSGGKYTVEAEKKLAKISERNHGTLVNSGSSANLILMSAAKELYFNDGDKILTLACGFPTTVNPIIQNRLIPKFVDIDIETLNLSPDVLRSELANDKKIKGVFVAHTLGFKSQIDELLDVAREFDVEVFFDNCDAYGTRYKNRPIQSYGKAATFSFYVAHHISMGEGGGVVTNDSQLHSLMRSYRNWGRYCASPNCCIRSIHPDTFCPNIKLTQNSELPDDYIVNYQYETLGYNLKPLELQSAMLLSQMDKLDEFNVVRQRNYHLLYNHMLKHGNVFKLWNIDEDVSPFGFPVLIRKNAPFKRKHFVDFLTQNQVESRMLFGGNLTRHPAYVNNKDLWCASNNLANSDNIMSNFIMIGVSPVVDIGHISHMCEKIDEFIARWK